MQSFVDKLARFFALLGGSVLLALVVLTCLSIAGRSINSVLHSDWFQSNAPEIANGLLSAGIGPINGDFELVEAGIAFVIFAFIPLCQWRSAHASVDIFTSRLPTRVNRVLCSLIEIVFAAVLILIAVQLFKGTLSKFNSGQTTFLLEFPVWWSYAICVFAAAVAAFVGSYLAFLRIVEVTTGRILLRDEGTESPDTEAIR